MNEELLSLQNSIILQLKEVSTTTYQRFLNAYDLMKDRDDKSIKEYEIICNSTKFLLDSMDFYFIKFIDLNNSELLLYIHQLTSVLVKSYHNLSIVYRNKEKADLSTQYRKLESLYKAKLYFYNLLVELLIVGENVHPLLLSFLKDAQLNDDERDIGRIIFLNFVKDNNLADNYFSNHDKNTFDNAYKSIELYNNLLS